MHIDVSRAYFHATAQKLVLVLLLVEDTTGADTGHIGMLRKSMYGTRDAAIDWQAHVESWGFQLGLSSKTLFCHEVQ